MIWESKHWKEGLARTDEFLRECGASPVIEDEEAQVRLEKEIMWAAYAIRKLQDSKKLSESVIRSQIFAQRCPSKSKHVNHMNSHKLHERFDFEETNQHTFSLRRFCNELIHSWIFATDHNDAGELEAILIASDNHRNKCVFRVELDEITKTIEAVSNDWPNTTAMTRDPKTGDWNVFNYCRKTVDD